MYSVNFVIHQPINIPITYGDGMTPDERVRRISKNKNWMAKKIIEIYERYGLQFLGYADVRLKYVYPSKTYHMLNHVYAIEFKSKAHYNKLKFTYPELLEELENLTALFNNDTFELPKIDGYENVDPTSLYEQIDDS